MQEKAYALLTHTPWSDPGDVGMFFTVPVDAITDTNQNRVNVNGISKRKCGTPFSTLRPAYEHYLNGILTRISNLAPLEKWYNVVLATTNDGIF